MYYSQPYNTPCLGCFLFNGYLDHQLCSVCYANHPDAPKLPDNHPPVHKWRSPDELDAYIDRWLGTGILSSQSNDTCRICLTEDLEVGSKFTCECSANVCLTCMPLINTCPICKAGQYCRISKRHLQQLVRQRCSTHVLGQVFRAVMLENHITSGCYTLYNMICLYEDIEEVMQGVDDYNLHLALYGLCANPWKLPHAANQHSSPLLCSGIVSPI